jgi:hypothetical protein
MVLVLLVIIGSGLWVTLIFPGGVCVVSVHILASNLRRPSAAESTCGGKPLEAQEDAADKE